MNLKPWLESIIKASHNAKLSEKVGVAGTLARANIKHSAADIVGKLGFWLIMLTFLGACRT